MFESMIKEKFYDDIFNTLNEDITDNYHHYDLDTRCRDVNEVLSASLDQFELIQVRNIHQEEEEVSFNLLVSCDIEVEDYAYGETIGEVICQWFELNCSAILENGMLDEFTVEGFAAYNK